MDLIKQHDRAYQVAIAAAQKRIYGMSIKELINLQQHMREWGTGTLKSCSHDRIALLEVIHNKLESLGVVNEKQIKEMGGV